MLSRKVSSRSPFAPIISIRASTRTFRTAIHRSAPAPCTQSVTTASYFESPKDLSWSKRNRGTLLPKDLQVSIRWPSRTIPSASPSAESHSAVVPLFAILWTKKLTPAFSQPCKLPLSQLFCFDSHLDCPGVEYSQQSLFCTPARSFGARNNSTRTFSIACAHFAKTPGCTPKSKTHLLLLPCRLAPVYNRNENILEELS
jgi:hypothetical protein